MVTIALMIADLLWFPTAVKGRPSMLMRRRRLAAHGEVALDPAASRPKSHGRAANSNEIW